MIGIGIDITALKEVQEELARSNRELERFAYVASHDLQEPLRMVSAYVSLLQKKLTGKDQEDIKEYVRYAVDGADRMRSLINALLAYSKAGHVKDVTETVNVRAAVDEALLSLSVAIKDYRAKISIKALPEVKGNHIELVRVFQNLIGNAIKYRGTETSAIEIGCDRRGNDWLVYVHDNGIGLDMKDSERIFEVFHRLHAKSDCDGTGIGLAICRRIVEAHGGGIWAESVPGKGSTFYFTLPASTSGMAASQQLSAKQPETKERPTSILMIDDEISLASAYRSLLKGQGFQVELATSGQEGLDTLKSGEPPDLILLDCAMPSMAGDEFMEHLSKEIPGVLDKSLIVGFSNFPPGSPITSRFESQVHRFVQKPSDIETFLSIIRELVSRGDSRSHQRIGRKEVWDDI
jgi:CheY-like chemotaxis protein